MRASSVRWNRVCWPSCDERPLRHLPDAILERGATVSPCPPAESLPPPDRASLSSTGSERPQCCRELCKAPTPVCNISPSGSPLFHRSAPIHLEICALERSCPCRIGPSNRPLSNLLLSRP